MTSTDAKRLLAAGFKIAAPVYTLEDRVLRSSPAKREAAPAAPGRELPRRRRPVTGDHDRQPGDACYV